MIVSLNCVAGRIIWGPSERCWHCYS